MVVSDGEDALTQINTALNKSMVLMENKLRKSPKPKERSRKSITINTSIQAASTPLQDSKVSRKSILKNTTRETAKDTSPRKNLSLSNGWLMDSQIEENTTTNFIGRPHNLQEFMDTEKLILDPTEQTYNLQNVQEDDELWIIDIPKSVNPHELRGHGLHLGEKTKIKIGEEKYQAVSQTTSDCLTCVFGTGREEKPYKIVNLRPSGTITLRRRLTSAAKRNSVDDTTENTVVPFPSGLKLRDPLVGVAESSKIRKKSKSRLKKRQSTE